MGKENLLPVHNIYNGKASRQLGSGLQGISNPGASKMADQLRAEMVDIDRDYASMRNQSAFNVDAMRMAEVYLQGAGSHEPVAPMFGGNN